VIAAWKRKSLQISDLILILSSFQKQNFSRKYCIFKRKNNKLYNGSKSSKVRGESARGQTSQGQTSQWENKSGGESSKMRRQIS